MKRREFIQKAGMGSISLAALPWGSIIEIFEENPKPYEFDLDSTTFQNDLRSNSLPRTININSRRRIPSKTSWGIGEGCTSTRDSGFRIAMNRHNSRMDNFWKIKGTTTPIFLLHTADHDVYGQFLSNDFGNFEYGIIQGHDKQFYIVHANFRRVFTYKHKCYGLPAQDYREIRCNKCGDSYIKQFFQKSCSSGQVALYAGHHCRKGGYCSGVPNIEALKPCGINDDRLKIGAEW